MLKDREVKKKAHQNHTKDQENTSVTEEESSVISRS